MVVKSHINVIVVCCRQKKKKMGKMYAFGILLHMKYDNNYNNVLTVFIKRICDFHYMTLFFTQSNCKYFTRFSFF